MRILVVEDDKSTLLILRLLLAGEGWQADGALDAVRGLEALSAKKFDWLVVDGQIQPMDGFELASRAKKIRPAIRIVMISGIYEADDIKDRPIDMLFPKPIDVDRLLAYLHDAGPCS